MQIKTRKATKEDLPAILNLVKELAEYEKLPNEVSVTLEDYERDFDLKIFDAIVAVDKGKVIGMVLFFMAYSTWKGRMVYLDDFVVTEQYRRLGLGKKLFDALVLETKRLNAKVLKWQVLNWNEPAIHFYKKYNATFEDDWLNCKFLEVDLEKWSSL